MFELLRFQQLQEPSDTTESDFSLTPECLPAVTLMMCNFCVEIEHLTALLWIATVEGTVNALKPPRSWVPPDGASARTYLNGDVFECARDPCNILLVQCGES